jgi:ribonuclease Z
MAMGMRGLGAGGCGLVEAAPALLGQRAPTVAITCRRRCVAAMLAICLGAALAGCERVQSALYERAADRALAGDRDELLGDGALHVILCGTGSPLPDPERAGPCTAVIAGGGLYLVDVGPGSWENVQLWRLPRAHLAGVLLTHFHSDHIGDLGEVVMQSWVGGRAVPLTIYGPPGVEDVVDGFRRAYAFDTKYRIAHHGESAMPPAGAETVAVTVSVPAPGQSTVVFEKNGLRVTAFSVDHRPVVPAFGYRFDYAGRSVVISGDTGPSDSLVQNAKGADLLVHEALAAHMIERIREIAQRRDAKRWAKLMGDIQTYHTTPSQAADIARQAGVSMLVLTHLVPAPQNALVKRLFLQGVDKSGIELVVGADGTHFTLPPQSKKIEIDSLE